MSCPRITPKLLYIVAVIKLISFFFITLALLPPYLIGKLLRSLIPSFKFDFTVRRLWSLIGLAFCGLKVSVVGESFAKADVYVSNHVSWLDILVIQTLLDVVFVAKSEVKSWPGFGFLAKIADTVFIDRRVMAAKSQQKEMASHLSLKKTLYFFPEGTSSNGLSVLPFKSSLFESMTRIEAHNANAIMICPITLKYHQPTGRSQDFFGWWGDMSLATNIVRVVAFGASGRLEVIFHRTFDATLIGDRKKIANLSELMVREGLNDIASATTIKNLVLRKKDKS
ncbi:MAG: 1-acyl-sn-glycerol-3-phosphate acyltransferase [Pseudomonadota bacterium]|nr:1-acyl-sn-glycerol-3-phosphate acyltransferase [Pseudomonadota bacterium]